MYEGNTQKEGASPCSEYKRIVKKDKNRGWR